MPLNLILIHENARPLAPNFVKEFFDDKRQKVYNQAKKSPNVILEGSCMLTSQEILQERQNFSKEVGLKKFLHDPFSENEKSKFSQKSKKVEKHFVDVVEVNKQLVNYTEIIIC